MAPKSKQGPPRKPASGAGPKKDAVRRKKIDKTIDKTKATIDQTKDDTIELTKQSERQKTITEKAPSTPAAKTPNEKKTPAARKSPSKSKAVEDRKKASNGKMTPNNRTLEDKMSTRDKASAVLSVQVSEDSPSDKEKEKDKRKRGFDNRDKPVTDQQKLALVTFAEKIMALGPKGVCDEFNNQLKMYFPPTCSRVENDKNQDKNRYDDVVCWDAHRVVLKPPGGDYIHANYVNGDPITNTFICTQGPLGDTVQDFWRMVVQEKVGTIMMLCKTHELGREKCAQYWPCKEMEVQTTGDFTIKNVEIDEKSDKTTCITKLEISQAGQPLFRLKHLQWKCWPDQSVPASHMAPFRLLRRARYDTRPTVVHCSAGIGRTGTLVAIEIGLQHLLSANLDTNLLEVIKKLRGMRGHCIQTQEQYLYLAACLLVFAEAHVFDVEFYNKNPDTKRKYKSFLDEYEQHIKKEAERNDKREKKMAKKLRQKESCSGKEDESGKSKASSTNSPAVPPVNNSLYQGVKTAFA